MERKNCVGRPARKGLSTQFQIDVVYKGCRMFTFAKVFGRRFLYGQVWTTM